MVEVISYNKLMILLIESNSINEVDSIGEYLTENKKNYSLVQLHYAKEMYDKKVKDLNIKFVTV